MATADNVARQRFTFTARFSRRHGAYVAAGRFGLRATIRRGGRTVDTCRSGTRRWTARYLR